MRKSEKFRNNNNSDNPLRLVVPTEIKRTRVFHLDSLVIYRRTQNYVFSLEEIGVGV